MAVAQNARAAQRPSQLMRACPRVSVFTHDGQLAARGHSALGPLPTNQVGLEDVKPSYFDLPMDLADSTLWVALLKIIWVNILLSGDNAVVIALAARNLPKRQQNLAILGGSGAAIVLRVVLTLFAVQLLQFPFLKLVGSALLLWIGIQLLAGGNDEGDVKASDSLATAIRTILVADLVMSLDNVIAVAAAANSAPENARTALLIAGLGLSIPLIIFGSTLLLKLMQRFPAIITLGAGLLGFVAGEMAVSDPAISAWFEAHLHGWELPISAVCAVAVILVGKWLARRAESGNEASAA
jgi:YjbE family integral membrane protein